MSATKRHALRRTAWSCIRRATTTRSIFIACTGFIRTISEGSRKRNQEKADECGSVHCGLGKMLSARYCMCWPPLIAILAPVTNAASSEHR
jgi:hypothetical protein